LNLDLDNAFRCNLIITDYESDDEGDAAEIAAHWAGIPASKTGKSSPTFCDNQCSKYNCLTCQPSIKSTFMDSTGQTKEVQQLMIDEELADLFTPSTGLHCPTPEVDYIGDGLISPTSRPPTPGPSGTLYDNETLDWGSEVNEYTLTSSKATIADASTVLHHPSKDSKDGNCNYMSVAAVNNLYSMTLSALDVLECEHHELFLQCAKCRVIVGSMWLLDSGASAHFMH